MLSIQHHWVGKQIVTENFVLQTYVPRLLKITDTVTVYIEGDGLAWINTSTPSSNPTPTSPLALKLALRDDSPSAYIARPCQYIELNQSPLCEQKFWTSDRFSPEVIRSTNQAIDEIKRQFSAKKIILVGYSGGGAVAALVAARRLDIIRLITIAGNLDHRTWTQLHHSSPLTNSLNPVDDIDSLKNIPQTHFVGGKDMIVSENVARAYVSKFPIDSKPSIVVMPEFDHACCWESSWPQLKRIN